MSHTGPDVPPRRRVRLRRDGLIRQPFYHVYVTRDAGDDEKIAIYNPMLPDEHPDMLILRPDWIEPFFGSDLDMPVDFAERAQRWRIRRENDGVTRWWGVRNLGCHAD
jgi:hypothetical protein